MTTSELRQTKRAERKKRDLQRVPRKPGESRLSHWVRVRKRAGVLRAAKTLRPAVNRTLGHFSKIGDAPYFEREQLDWVADLEGSFEAIRKEAEFVLQARAQLPPLHRISPDHNRIDEDDKWKVYFLKGYGNWIEDHCAQCPETARAVRRIPGVESAFFSILEPGKHIRRHTGPTRAIFTAHLGVLLPEDRENCWLEVGGIREHWDPGKTLLFDDTYRHRVVNDTPECRVVLLLHVRRPLRFPGSMLGRAAMAVIKWSPFVRDAMENQRRWEKQR